MDVSSTGPSTGIAELEDAAPRWRTHWPVMVGSGVLVVTACLGAWLWSHPSTFEDGGGDMVEADSWKANTAFYTGLTFADPRSRGTVTIVSAHPRQLSPRGVADTGFYVCTVDPAAHIGGVLSASASEIGESCSSLVPAAGAKIALDARPFQVLVMKITPNKAGQTISVKGADVTYRHGWQRGTQRLGSEVRIHTTTG